MFKNYLKTAFRNLVKNKFYTLINIIGLALGIATCLLILLYVMDELSYDRYNLNANRIYRVNNEIKFGDNHVDLAVAPSLMGTTMVKEIPQVEQYTRIQWHGSLLIRKGSENLREERIAYGDSTLFEVFTLPMLAGDPKTALREPHSLVITETIAKKYFNGIDAVGKEITVNDSINYKVTGVIKDIPSQSHFNFDIFVATIENPLSRDDNWLSENWNTYILVKKNTDLNKLNLDLNKMMDRYVGPELQGVTNMTLDQFKKGGGYVLATLTPLTDIHLNSNRTAELEGNGNIQFVFIFSAIAIFILLIACVNFMNLSTARSFNRAKEVGVRKVLGSLRINLIQQFLSESVLISFIALIFAVLIAWLLMPYFNQLAGKTIRVNTIFQPGMLFSLVILMLIVGLLAGSYPAFFLSAFQPISVLKGKLTSGFKKPWLRNGLVVFQFVITIILIIGTIVIFNQLNYIRAKDIGYNRNQVLVINGTYVLGNQATTFKNELLQISGIQRATLTGFLPSDDNNRSNDAFFTSPALDPKSAISMQIWNVDEDYIPTLGMKIIEGRNFSLQYPTDSTGIIINEAAVKFLNAKDILNKKLYEINDLKSKILKESHIIGVIRNFNFSSLRDLITPLALRLGKNNNNISVRIGVSNTPAVISVIKSIWKQMASSQPFDYSFMDDQFNKQYTSEEQVGRISITFAILAIAIACLGLFGLVTYAAEQRTKEIGIRKVLGANVPNIVSMIIRDFLKLVIIASVIAFPIASWGMKKWLQNFAYRVDIAWWIFLIAALVAIIITLVTISFQAIKAAIANPVTSLRSE
ncbi:MAG TPA: ABC transporter permease [Puia sp.]|nr:ABC transporter permease [Puia sp.]